MKKVFVFLLAALLVCALTACGEKEDVRGDITPGGDKTENVTTTTTAADVEEEAELELGNTNGGVYENAFLGIGCRLSSPWAYYTDEQIREANNLSMDMAGEEVKEQLANASVIYDMMAQNAETGGTVQVVLEKVGAVNALAAIADPQAYYDAAIPTIRDGLSNMGCENIDIQVVTHTIGGKTFPGMSLVADINGTKMYEKQLVIVKGDYLACITFVAVGADDTNAVLQNFYLMD